MLPDDDEPKQDPGELVPIAFWVRSVPIPDLKQIPEERWVALLRQIPDEVRDKAVQTAPWGRFDDAARAVLVVEREEREARESASIDMVAFPPPLPGASGEMVPPRPARQRQVAFRLYRPQYEEVERAAEKLGLKPAQLARLLTLRGVAQILAERQPG